MKNIRLGGGEYNMSGADQANASSREGSERRNHGAHNLPTHILNRALQVFALAG